MKTRARLSGRPAVFTLLIARSARERPARPRRSGRAARAGYVGVVGSWGGWRSAGPRSGGGATAAGWGALGRPAVFTLLIARSARERPARPRRRGRAARAEREMEKKKGATVRSAPNL